MDFIFLLTVGRVLAVGRVLTVGRKNLNSLNSEVYQVDSLNQGVSRCNCAVDVSECNVGALRESIYSRIQRLRGLVFRKSGGFFLEGILTMPWHWRRKAGTE